MKRILFTGGFLVSALMIYAQSTEEKKEEAQPEVIVPGPVIAFEEESHDFGDIVEGDVVEWTFKFENKGDTPLILSNVAVTCGCTATQWPKDPIAVDEKGEITVKFNSAGRKGAQNKVISVYSNAAVPIARVSIVTNVLPKKKKGD